MTNATVTDCDNEVHSLHKGEAGLFDSCSHFKVCLSTSAHLCN